MTSEERKVKVEKFDDKDFACWKLHMKDLLYQNKLYHPLTRHKLNEQLDWEFLSQYTLGIILFTLVKNVTFNVLNKKTTLVLSNMYTKSSTTNKVYLIRRLVNLIMTIGNLITNHVNEFNTIIVQLSLV